ncbi:MAG: ABC transporter ATP-binding protein [Betaproteobacteria bacterium]|nr:MAG: ABC transporter ATP-binding protein [Betaproteobacteria bacterium]
MGEGAAYPQTATEPAVRIAALVKRYGALVALDKVDLSIAQREAFGLVGANGAGKTTLIRCLLDLTACDQGRIEIFGRRAREPMARAPLAYLPERFMPPHYLTGREFLRTLAALGRAGHDEARIAALIAQLELEPAALERPVRTLSKGMTQKLGLAAVLSLERELYVLDEPMSGLDPAARVAVKSVLSRLSREGRTLFFTSHVLADVDELCSSIAVLERARLRFRGSPRSLRERYGERSLERAFMRCLRDGERALSA